MIDEKIEVTFENQHLPILCDNCGEQGFIFVDNIKQSYLIICHNCGGETSQVWCPKCGIGVAYGRDIDKHPSFWVCLNCDTNYELANTFYDNPVELYLEKELPLDAYQRIEKASLPNKSRSLKQTFYGWILFLIIIALLVIPWGLMYKLLSYLPWSKKISF